MRIGRRQDVAAATSAIEGFEYLEPGSIYLDTACQTLRPRPVIEALTGYYTGYGGAADGSATRGVGAWTRRSPRPGRQY